MIWFITQLYRKPSRQSIYWALEEVKRAEQVIGRPVAYHHVTQDTNAVADDMAWRALEGMSDVLYWDGETPRDTPAN